jgi:transposase-like protein
MAVKSCPKCQHTEAVKCGIIKERQRFRCKACAYCFTVDKLGKQIDSYYVIKALQLYIEGVSYREIERLLGVSHVSVMNWVKQYQIQRPNTLTEYHPTYHIFSHTELLEFMNDPKRLIGAGLMVTEVGKKYMVIRWERFKN